MSSILRTAAMIWIYNMYLLNADSHDCETVNCHDATIYCTPNEPCDIICKGESHCSETHFYCPDDQECIVNCAGDVACEHLTIYAKLSSDLSVTCLGTYDTCVNIVVYCPQNAEGIKKCTINANNNLHGYIHDITGDFLELYAVNGWNDVRVIYSGNGDEGEVDGQYMFCTSDYSEFCRIVPGTWTCQNPAHICNNPPPQTQYPTTGIQTTAFNPNVCFPLETLCPSGDNNECCSCFCKTDGGPNRCKNPGSEDLYLAGCTTTEYPSYMPSVSPTANPSTFVPSTAIPSSNPPTTTNPTTSSPTNIPSTNNPTSSSPTAADPTSFSPTTMNPTSAIPTSMQPSTANPSSFSPTTSFPPSTLNPTTASPSQNPSSNPTSFAPTTINPTTSSPTKIPSTNNPTSSSPTTADPTTAQPTTMNPTSSNPTTTTPTTAIPTSMQPSTTNPTSFSPTTSFPTSFPTSIPTSSPTSMQPSTLNPTTATPSQNPSLNPTSFAPTTIHPTTTDPSSSPIQTPTATTEEGLNGEVGNPYTTSDSRDVYGNEFTNQNESTNTYLLIYGLIALAFIQIGVIIICVLGGVFIVRQNHTPMAKEETNVENINNSFENGQKNNFYSAAMDRSPISVVNGTDHNDFGIFKYKMSETLSEMQMHDSEEKMDCEGSDSDNETINEMFASFVDPSICTTQGVTNDQKDNFEKHDTIYKE